MTLQYRIAEEHERPTAISLIEQVFRKELGYEGVRSDGFDEHAVFLVGLNNGSNGNMAVAALRLVPDGPHGLPLDRYFDLSHLRSRSERLAEVSRFACLKEYRGLTAGIRPVRFLKETVEHLGFTHLVIDALLTLVPLYERMGFKKYGEPFFDPSVQRSGEPDGTPNSQVMFLEMKDLNKC